MSRQNPTNEVFMIAEVNPVSPITESYRDLRTNTTFALRGVNASAICVTSCHEGEGKTTTAANLAVAYAHEGKRTLLIDADLRSPSQHKAFAVTGRLGLSTALVKEHDFESAIVPTHIKHLSLLPAGPLPPNPAELLASEEMDDILAQASERFDVIILDSSPVLPVTDAQIVASKSDGVLLVIGAGKVKKAAARKAKEKLEHVRANVLGVVMNGIKHSGVASYKI